MKKINLLLLLGLLGLYSCSSNDSSSDGEEGIELSDESSSDDISEFESDDDAMVSESNNGSDEIVAVDETIEEGNDTSLVSQDVPGSISSSPISVGLTGNTGEYTVKSGDTMMLVAFKVYGDYSRWKSIARLNPSVNSNSLSAGTVLKYNAPSVPFVWNPRGNPHLIKSGDSLGAISKEKYGTPSKWKSIYDNNRPMIKNPNLIFAGFTLYWLAERDIASQN